MSRSMDEASSPGKARLVPFVAIAILTSSIFTFQGWHANKTMGTIADSDDQLITNAFRAIRGSFIENKGQVDEDIRYYSMGNPSVGFRDDGIMIVLSEITERSNPLENKSSVTDTSVGGFAFMIRFEDSWNVAPLGIKELDFATNLLIGNNPARWSTDVRSYQEIAYVNLYDGIDLIFHLSDQGLKYDIIVNGDVDPSRIRFAYEGVNNLSLDSEGGLHIQTALGELRDAAPVAWRDGHAVPCDHTLPGRHVVGLRCTDWRGRDRLVIDPLIYSTFLGGSSSDHAWAVALDASDNAYVTGNTLSVDFPTTPGTFDLLNNGGQDVFVVKMNATGTGLVYSTYIGGSGTDFGFSIVVDDLDNVFLAGQTRSPDFPTTPGAFDRLCGTDGNCNFDGARYYYDAFVARLDAAGDSLVYSTFLGGEQSEGAHSIAVIPTGEAFVTGQTTSPDFPTTAGAFDRMCGTDGNCDYDGTYYYDDAFVTRVDATGGNLTYSTFLGGANHDSGLSVKADSFGNAYLTGDTSSAGFPTTPGAYDVAFNGGLGDAFVTKMNPSGSALVYSTFLGGSGIDDTGESIAIDILGNAFIVGQTYSSDFPTTPGAFDRSQNSPSQYDVFVTKVNASGDDLIYSTFLGGSGEDGGTMEQVGLTATGDMYVTGFTNSPNFPTTPGAFDRTCGTFGNCDFDGTRYRYDAFLTLFDANGSSLLYSTFLGGEDDDFGRALAMNSAGDAYVAGGTSSINFPATPEAFRPVSVGGGDAFILKFTPLPDLSVLSISSVPTPPILVGESVAVVSNLTNLGDVDAAMFEVLAFDDQNLDGIAGPSEDIGSQLVALLPASMQANVSFPWTPNTTGTHSICVSVDSLNTVQESNETNNMACVSVQVLSLPDLVPHDLNVAPSSPILESTMSRINATVSNEGDRAAGAFDVLLFDDKNGDKNPDAGEQIGINGSSGIIGHSQSGFTFDWTATPTGPHSICAYADPPPGMVSESNETNNVACIDVVVQPGPILRPDYIPVSPLPLSLVKVGMSSRIDLSIQVYNQGNGTATDNAIVAFREQSSPPFASFVLGPLAPAITSSQFTATWTSPAIPGTYSVSVDVDYDNNITEWDETNNVFTWTIEVVSGPVTSLVIGNPNYTSTAMMTYIRSSTPLDLSVLDQSGLGIRNTTYTVDGGNAVNYTATGTFSLTVEGVHTIQWQSLDWAGNLEDVSSMDLTVDDTPPATTIHQSEMNATTATVFTLAATDSGCGVNVTRYRIDGGSWTIYSGGFTLPEGEHNISFFSNDTLNNTEREKWLVVTVEGTTTPPEVAVNYKPLVAAIFAIILLVAGIGSSKRRPWRGGKERMATVKAFAITSLPFVLAEAATGILSLAVEPLRIPPMIGWGTGVDLLILVGGLVLAILRLPRKAERPQDSDESVD